jgi:hypothetical protein
LKALKRRRNADEKQERAKELMRFRDTATTADCGEYRQAAVAVAQHTL